MHVFRKVLGVVLIVIGFLALLTPFTPGSGLILVGLAILGVELAIDEHTWLGRTAKKLGIKLKKKPEAEKAG